MGNASNVGNLFQALPLKNTKGYSRWTLVSFRL
ncbi:hypothetical protein [Sporosarcina sp. Te-1]|nr:hypothetical protein J3U78_00360 [Sporosarcina sp. Te-1]